MQQHNSSYLAQFLAQRPTSLSIGPGSQFLFLIFPPPSLCLCSFSSSTFFCSFDISPVICGPQGPGKLVLELLLSCHGSLQVNQQGPGDSPPGVGDGVTTAAAGRDGQPQGVPPVPVGCQPGGVTRHICWQDLFGLAVFRIVGPEV